MSDLNLKKKSYNIMIVDDSDFIRSQLMYILEDDIFKVVDSASDGEEFLSKYKKQIDNIDLITLDISMPKMDGLTALREAVKINRNVLIIIISSIDSADTVKRALFYGAKNYIVKPLNKERVIDTIKRTLSLEESKIG